MRNDNDWVADLNWSRRALLEILWPQWLQTIIGGLDLKINEDGRRDNFLDQDSGIDAWIRLPGGRTRGLASRIQDANNYWAPSFTYRSNRHNNRQTEAQKRREAIAHDDVFPHVTCQGYADLEKQTLVMAGLIETRQLDAAFNGGVGYTQKNPAKNFGRPPVEFRVMYWIALREAGYQLESFVNMDWINDYQEPLRTELARRYRLCSECGQPMVAGQKGAHLSCQMDPLPGL